MSGRLVPLACLVHDLALGILPADLLDRHGEELRDCFRALTEEARSRGALAVVWTLVRSLLDLATRAPREHRIARELAPRGAAPLAGFGHDLRHAARRLRRRPSFTLTTVLTLGVGLAAAIAVLSLVYGVVLRPLPYPDSERLVRLDHAAPGADIEGNLGIAPGLYYLYRDHGRSLAAIAAYRDVDPTLVGDGEPVRLRGVLTTPSLGEVLGVEPALGRWFRPEEGEPGGATDVVVLSHAFWQERLGGSADALGRVLDLDGEPHEVVGVMPAGFAFPDREVAVWAPWVVRQNELGGFWAESIARLRPGVALDAARRDLASTLPRLREIHPEEAEGYLEDAKVTPLPVPLLESVLGDVEVTLYTLGGAAAFLLLVAVANVANLFWSAPRTTAARRRCARPSGRPGCASCAASSPRPGSSPRWPERSP